MSDSGHWLPVESNPQVFNAYAQRLGWPTERLAFSDVMSTEEWALAMVPKPVAAVLMLFPIIEVQETAAAALEGTRAPASPLYFVKQEIANACGTIALLHAVANSPGGVEPSAGSWLARFLGSTRALSPAARAEALAADDSIEEAHDAEAHAGQSAVVDDTHQHFVCFVQHGGRLWELDGRQSAPRDCGPSSPESLLEDSAAAVKEYMKRDPEELRFTMLALAPPAPDDE